MISRLGFRIRRRGTRPWSAKTSPKINNPTSPRRQQSQSHQTVKMNMNMNVMKLLGLQHEVVDAQGKFRRR
jgi:hypothetical protein